jgi:extracellular factor (EF) 3-hydroxypalmitic acid methyl ester biosynthesis protein
MFHFPIVMALHKSGNDTGTALLAREARKKPVGSSPLSPEDAQASAENTVTFKTSDGVSLRGVPARMRRHAAVVELYSPIATPRLSESLADFKIILQGREIYSGHAVVGNIVDAGTKIICEVSLELLDWIDLDLLLAVRQGQAEKEIKNFLDEWQKSFCILDEFKIAVANMQTFFRDLRLLLDRTELRFQAQSPSSRQEIEPEVLSRLETAILPAIDSLFEKFEEVAQRIREDDQSPAMNYMRQHLHPLILCAPFANNTFNKPRGYAGDFQMVNMIERNGFEGESFFAKIIHRWFVKQPPAEAHRNRIRYLVGCLEKEVHRAVRAGRPAKILNFACGPAAEVGHFISNSILAGDAEFTLQDQDEQALNQCQQSVSRHINKRRIDTLVTCQRKSIFQLVKESQQTPAATPKKQFDLVYCAGLFDYVAENTCKQLTDIFYSLVSPGGLLLVTNVNSNNPLRFGMEHLLDWHLIYRNEAEIRALAPAAARENVCVRADETGVNLFLEVRKPDHV